MIDYDLLMARRFPEVRHSYTTKDTILYALGVGAGEGQLRYVYENGLEALPTMALVLAYPGVWVREPDTGIDWRKVVNASQGITLHRSIPVEGCVRGRTRIDGIVDKGPGRGALILTTRDIMDDASGELLCSVSQTMFCRGDGGFGGPTAVPPPPLQVPERSPDMESRLVVDRRAGLIYRLSGDDNPLHADPDVARSAGFERPILHGAATFGAAGLAIVELACAGCPSRLRTIEARFSAPVFPGDVLTTMLWDLGYGAFAFRCVAPERNQVVLDLGHAVVAPKLPERPLASGSENGL